MNATSPTSQAIIVGIVRRTHRFLIKAFLVVLPFVVLWSWLGPPADYTMALRISSSLAALIATPIVLLVWIDPPTTMYILSTQLRRRRTLDRPQPVFQEFVTIDHIAKPMALAVIVTEDPYFLSHVGFDPIEIWNAYQYNRKQRKPGRNLRGASTISQQMTKNLFLAPTQSYARKIVEAFLTALIEGLWTKRRILEVYLNIIEFGEGIFGVEAAAKHFFGKSACRLTRDEAGLLAVALRAPRIYRVADPSPAMLKAKAEILNRMEGFGQAIQVQLATL
ncbi:MAG: monofunctional biosynthetic peptidoglycan transglycosylase [Gammaproteobacteria bacterium]|nr:monofunctional biosynthetic peptidoglycan transglycosylase [Gammaproteobacteria bacterium]